MAVPLTWRKCLESKEKWLWVRMNCRYAAPGWPGSREWSVWWMRGGSWKNGGIAEGWWDGGVELTMTHT